MMIQQSQRSKCVYCKNNDHLGNFHTLILNTATRQSILLDEKIYFNCMTSSQIPCQCQWKNYYKYVKNHQTPVCIYIQNRQMTVAEVGRNQTPQSTDKG